MGEIADALRRANAGREEGHEGSASPAINSSELPKEIPPAVEDKAEPDSTYSDALALEDSFGPEPPRSPAPPAPAPPPTFAEPAAFRSDELEREKCELEITDEEGPYSPARAVLMDHEGSTAESFRHFALRVSREVALLGNRAIMVVSGVRGEGKTTTASNLALGLASITGDKNIALVDMDFRRPALGRYLGSKRAVGIDAVLRGEADLDQARVRTNFSNLDLFPVVRPVRKPHELLGSDVLSAILSQLRSRYHTVIIDTPPVLVVPDVELMLPFCGGCIAVVRARLTRVEDYRQLAERLPKDKFLGTFLNEAPSMSFRKRGKDYYYGDTDFEEEGLAEDYDDEGAEIEKLSEDEPGDEPRRP